MHFALGWTGVLLGSAMLLGCAVSGPDSPRPVDDIPQKDPEIKATLAFEGPTTLELSPGEERAITVVASPPDSYEMYFALRDPPGDASLDAGHLVTDEDGRATVKLHAPSTPASFMLRAWIKDGPAIELAVSVSKLGVGTIEVLPQYDGVRGPQDWVASVVIGTTCDALAPLLPGEVVGALVAASPSQENPLIQSVPVGPKLAVAVRSGHSVVGCSDAHELAAGQTIKVKVHMVDVPLALDRTSLDITLAYAPDAAPYGKVLSSARSQFLGTFLPPQQAEAQTVLDAMEALADEPSAFAEARSSGGWDTLAEAHFAQMPAPLGDKMSEWMDIGLGAAAPEVSGRLLSIEGVPGKALFMVDRIGGLDAVSAGAPPAHLMSWTSAPGDKVFLKGTVFWLPSRFLGTACHAGADKDLGVIQPMGEALAKVARCSDLATALGETSTCDKACLASLCRAALTRQWEAALDASAASDSVGTIDIGASGIAKVDDVATPVAISGMWLGSVSDGQVAADVSGEAAGQLSEPDAPPPEDPSNNPPQ
jgi:hypothetical protein